MAGNKTIMVVDDDLVSLKVVGKFLENQGYSVNECAEGPSAVRRARTAAPDLILLDLGMPSPNLNVCPVPDWLSPTVGLTRLKS
ncbi:MAG: response regulator [Verrucomicrobia bacterium]|nr:response regulator [Verrucomicrobiota bacterium]